MEAGFPYGDIIVIGAIAAFILLRYRAMLGEPRGRDERTIRKDPASIAATLAEIERVVQLPSARAGATTEKKEDDFSAYGTLAERFVAIRAIDREFTPDDFLHGARTAYEMLIVAFSKRDRETLKMLLSEAMFKSFALSLEDAEKAKRFTDTTLIAITKAAITDARLVGSMATLTVHLVSDQIHLIRDDSGVILEGNVSQENIVEDEWIFTRDLKSNTPNWVIIET